MSRASCQKSDVSADRKGGRDQRHKQAGGCARVAPVPGAGACRPDRTGKTGWHPVPGCNWQSAPAVAPRTGRRGAVVPCARAAASRSRVCSGARHQADEPGRSFCGLAGQPGDGGQRPVAPVVGEQGGLKSPGRIGLLGPAVPGGVHLGHGGQGALARCAGSAGPVPPSPTTGGAAALCQRGRRRWHGESTAPAPSARVKASAGTGSASAGPLLLGTAPTVAAQWCAASHSGVTLWQRSSTGRPGAWTKHRPSSCVQLMLALQQLVFLLDQVQCLPECARAQDAPGALGKHHKVHARDVVLQKEKSLTRIKRAGQSCWAAKAAVIRHPPAIWPPARRSRTGCGRRRRCPRVPPAASTWHGLRLSRKCAQLP